MSFLRTAGPLRLPARPIPLVWALAFAVLSSVAGAKAFASRPEGAPEEVSLLPTAYAVPVRVDTLFLGGYARGSFAEAVGAVAGELSDGEQIMIGRHLDRIFSNLLVADGLGRGGRLRLAYERVARPDGSTRSIRVLAAEAAVRGELHTAFFFEEADKPGYFDALGRALDERGWGQPLGMIRVTSSFGLRRMHPILGRVLPHTGTDYAAAAGTPVRAVGDGNVSFAAARGGYGNLVEIHHPNGYATRYAHLAAFAPGIRNNVAVQQGEVIGYVGMTGLATGPHLHYEVRRRDRPVDPESVGSLSGPAGDLAASAQWRDERRRLGGLLARAPRLVSSRARSGV
ncbi:MAG: M23 family metallopeptidase [Gemmatimonadota bacterium]|nr:M23 family metallopeptidase [Gemmatimonadota bacterium]